MWKWEGFVDKTSEVMEYLKTTAKTNYDRLYWVVTPQGDTATLRQCLVKTNPDGSTTVAWKVFQTFSGSFDVDEWRANHPELSGSGGGQRAPLRLPGGGKSALSIPLGLQGVLNDITLIDEDVVDPEEIPDVIEESPIPIGEGPGDADESPGDIDESPCDTDESPGDADESPGDADESPIPVGETPVPVEEDPGETGEETTYLLAASAKVNEALRKLIDEWAGTEHPVKKLVFGSFETLSGELAEDTVWTDSEADLSDEEDGSIRIFYNEETGIAYVLTETDGTLYANEDSDGLLDLPDELEIDSEALDVSRLPEDADLYTLPVPTDAEETEETAAPTDPSATEEEEETEPGPAEDRDEPPSATTGEEEQHSGSPPPEDGDDDPEAETAPAGTEPAGRSEPDEKMTE